MEQNGGERTVFVVGGDEPTRASLFALLKADGLAARAYDAPAEFLESFDPLALGCIVMDLRLPFEDGIGFIQMLKARGSLLPVIILTDDVDVPSAVAAMKAGASDLFQRPCATAHLRDAIAARLADNAAAAAVAAERRRVERRLARLTARERQVLDLIIEGASNKVVAQTLQISPRTVEIYRANIMQKMRAESLPDLIRFTITAGAA